MDLDEALAEGTLLDLARFADLDDLTLVDDGYAIAQPLSLFDVMRGQEDGALGVAELLDQAVDLEANLGIEPGGRLIQKQELRIVDQGQSEGYALFLSAGKFGVIFVPLFRKLQAIEELVAVDTPRVERGKQLQSFVDLDFIRQVGGLQADADPVFDPARFQAGIVAEHQRLAGAALPEPFEDLDRGGLARAVGAEQAEYFAGEDLERETADCFKIAVALPQTANGDDAAVS